MVNAEIRVRRSLSEEFGIPFIKMQLQVGIAIDGKPALKEFDAVSKDQMVIAMVKDFTAKNERGNQTRHARVMRDLYYLSLCEARQRFLYLSPSYYIWLKTQRDSAIAANIKVRLIPEPNAEKYDIVSETKFQKSSSVNGQSLEAYSIVCESKHYEGNPYLYWWDIWDSRKSSLIRVGEIHFVKKDTGERAIVSAGDLIPLLTERRRTSRMGRTTGGNWGIKVLPDHPDKLAIEEPGVAPGNWAKIRVRWLI